MKGSLLIPVKELCNLLSISQNTAYSLVRENAIPHVRIKGKILFNRQIIEEWSKDPSKFNELKEVN